MAVEEGAEIGSIIEEGELEGASIPMELWLELNGLELEALNDSA